MTNDYLFNLPTNNDFYNVLTKTIAPNFTFTQSNLYDCIAQVMLYLDGVATLDNNNVLGIEYFNDNNGTKIDKVATDTIMTINNAKYINGLLTDYQNGSLNRDITFPSKMSFSQTQSISAGIPTTSDYVFRTNKEIRELKTLNVKLSSFHLVRKRTSDRQEIKNYDYTFICNFPIDLSRYVIEKDLWTNLLRPADLWTGNSDYLGNTQYNTLYYTKGSNIIYVGTLNTSVMGTETYAISQTIISAVAFNLGFPHYTYNNGVYDTNYYVSSTSPNNPLEMVYQVSYEPILNGRVEIESTKNKYNGNERLDINQGSCDLSKLGLNMLGTATKCGNLELNRTEQFSTFENRIKKGSILYKDNVRYIADTVDTTIFKDYCVSQVHYTQNFNKLSNFIRLNQDKRFNQIDNSLVMKSEDIYKEYLYFSMTDFNVLNGTIHLLNNAISNGFFDTFTTTPSYLKTIDYVSCLTSNLDGSTSDFGNVYLPLVKYGSGNALCFEMSFESPINAGTQMITTQDTWFSQSHYSQYILYANKNGFADMFDISFYHINTETINSSFPQLPTALIDNSTKIGSFDKLLFYKKPNEIFALNYELICLPYQNQDLFIGENFIKNNGIVGNAQIKQGIKLYVSTTMLYSILDNKALGTQLSGAFNVSISGDTTSSYITALTFIVYQNGLPYLLDRAIKSWAITDDNDNLLISCNQDLAINDRLVFYVKSSHTRI